MTDINKNVTSAEELMEFFSSYNDADKIVESLKERTDLDAIQSKLTVLLASEKYPQAMEMIRDQEIDKAWYNLAIVASVKTGTREKSSEILSWASKQDTKTWHRAIYLYTIYQFKHIWRNREKNAEISVGSLSENEKKELRQLIDTIQPLLKYIEGVGRIRSKIYKEIIDVSLKSFTLLEDKENASKYSCYSDDPLVLAQLALCQLIELPPNLIITLEDIRDSFEAQKYALLLRLRYGKLTEKYFEERVATFSNYLSSKEQRIEIFQVFNEMAHTLGEGSVDLLKQFSTEYLGEDSRLLKLFSCENLLNNKKLPDAYKILLDTKDENDPLWLQLYANYLYFDGKAEDALEYIDKARKLMPHPELSKSEAQIAFEAKHYDLSIELLEHELKKNPDSLQINHNLSEAYFQKRDYEPAVSYYEKLIQLKNDELLYYMRLAQCYMQLGEQDKSIEVYNIICKREDAPLEAFLAKAYLEKIDDPKKAFETILPLKDVYWESPQYLQAVLDLSYVSGNEEYGHQALLKIRDLQKEGKAPQEILQIKTIDDLKAHVNQWNEKVKTINQNILNGKFTWTMADHWQNHASYIGWYIRTRQIDWLFEEPMTRAIYSIYSTNGFTAVKQSDDTTRLEHIKCPDKTSKIVIDLSSLITLHRLDLLKKCVDYFSTTFVLQEYPVKLLQDCDRLVIHQQSIKISAQAIKKAIVTGHLSILEDVGRLNERPLPYINEHTLPEKEEEHYYRLIDLINVAYHSGKLDEEKYNSLTRIAYKPSGIDSGHPELHHGQSIWVDLHTLRSICQIDITALEPILEAFKVFISKEDQNYNSNEVSQIETQETIKKWNDSLLQEIKKDIFTKESHTADPQLENDDIFLASWELAKDKALPLLTDDRVLQVLAINSSTDIEYPAFGTDRLLFKLFEDNIIDIDIMSDAFIKLMQWRYRFIIPPEEVLVNLARRYKSHPPGKHLREFAIYVHDCMRDPGLFSGQENTTLKESMAARLFLSWTRLIATFLVEIWSDSDFSDDNAKEITEWAINEFVPSLPKGIVVNCPYIANKQFSIFFNCFYTQTFAKNKNRERDNKSLQVISDCMNMNDTEYYKAISEVVDIYGI